MIPELSGSETEINRSMNNDKHKKEERKKHKA
jgi:hypothetical protein